MNKTVGFGQAFKNFWKNYANFKGRARRSEYWWMMLWHLIFSLPLIFVVFIGTIFLGLGAAENTDDASAGLLVIGLLLFFIAGIYGLIYFLATLVPYLSLLVRRFHDAGRGTVLPIIIFIISVVLSIFIQVYGNLSRPDLTLDYIIVLMIVSVISLAMGVYTIVIACLDSKRGRNPYGESKKYPSELYGDESKVTVF